MVCMSAHRLTVTSAEFDSSQEITWQDVDTAMAKNVANNFTISTHTHQTENIQENVECCYQMSKVVTWTKMGSTQHQTNADSGYTHVFFSSDILRFTVSFSLFTIVQALSKDPVSFGCSQMSLPMNSPEVKYIWFPITNCTF